MIRSEKPGEAEVWPLGSSEEPTDWLVPLVPRLGIEIDREQLETESEEWISIFDDVLDVLDKVNLRPEEDGYDRSIVGSLLGEVAAVDGSVRGNVEDLMNSRMDATAASL